MLEKPKRYVSEENLQLIRDRPCSVCYDPPPSDPEHIKTKGSGGGDELFNLVSLCRLDHIKVHKIGLIKLANENKSLKKELESKGWNYDDYFRKWKRDMDTSSFG